jgi:hypothetical protein
MIYWTDTSVVIAQRVVLVVVTVPLRSFQNFPDESFSFRGPSEGDYLQLLIGGLCELKKTQAVLIYRIPLVTSCVLYKHPELRPDNSRIRVSVKIRVWKENRITFPAIVIIIVIMMPNKPKLTCKAEITCSAAIVFFVSFSHISFASDAIR